MIKLSPRIWVYSAGELAPPKGLAFAQIHSDAFGDGTHATTRLCAQAVDVLTQPGWDVLDVGTGTGILARIAKARGAARVVGTDIDDRAIAAAQANVEAGIEIQRDIPSGKFHLIVANILQKPLLSLAATLRASLHADGLLLLSGFTQAESPVLRAAYQPLVAKPDVTQDGWVLLQLRHAPRDSVRRV